MHFCLNCNYVFDISKSSKMSKDVDDRKGISKLADAIAKIENNEDMTKYKAEFSRDEMSKNKKYQKMEDSLKIKINQLFEEISSSGAEFKCGNCNYIKSITETTKLYELNMNDEISNIKSLEENEYTCKDPLLPHTHDYTCKNPNCITHKNPKLKDSVFYKNNSYKPTYICCVCFYSWLI